MTGFGEFPLIRRHHNLLAAQGTPNITGPIQKGNGGGKSKTGGGSGPTVGKGHGKGNGASGPSLPTYSQDFPYLVGWQSANLSGTGGSISTSSLSDEFEGGIAEGDLVIVAIGTAENSTTQTHSVDTSGYEQIDQLLANDTWDARLSVWWKIQGATPDTSVSISGMNDASRATTAILQVWRNVDPTVPFDVRYQTAAGANSATPNAPAIVPNSSASTILAIGCGADDGGTVTNGNTTLTGWDGANASEAEGTIDVGLAIAWLQDPTHAVEVDPPAWSGWEGDSLSSWAAMTVVLRNQSGAEAGTPVGWTLVGTSEISVTNTTSQVETLPGSPAEGDVVLVFAAQDGTAFPTGNTYINTANYVDIYHDNLAGSSATQIAYKVLGASPDTQIDLKCQTTSFDAAVVIQIWRGARTDRVLDGMLTVESGSGTNIYNPAHTMSQIGALDILAVQINEVNPSDTLEWNPNGAPPSPPSGYTNEALGDAGNSGSANAIFLVASKVNTAVGERASVEWSKDTAFNRAMEFISFSLTNRTA